MVNEQNYLEVLCDSIFSSVLHQFADYFGCVRIGWMHIKTPSKMASKINATNHCAVEDYCEMTILSYYGTQLFASRTNVYLIA